VSDVRLQGVSAGPLLAELFAAQGKSRIILLMSGYTHSVQIDGKQGVLTFPLLRKPFDKEALYDALLQAHHALTREEVHDQ
jgi:FixJ family two-component response regulator